MIKPSGIQFIAGVDHVTPLRNGMCIEGGDINGDTARLTFEKRRTLWSAGYGKGDARIEVRAGKLNDLKSWARFRFA